MSDTTKTGRFDSVAEIRRANKDLGHHWFDPGAIRFFDATIGRAVYAGRMFGHSIRFSDETPRQYRVAVARDSGAIEQIDHDWADASSRDAFLRQRHTVEVRFDPHRSEVGAIEAGEENADANHYLWRVYVGGLPVGCPNTLAKCRTFAGEITGEEE
jgi:hypothetical protein